MERPFGAETLGAALAEKPLGESTTDNIGSIYVSMPKNMSQNLKRLGPWRKRIAGAARARREQPGWDQYQKAFGEMFYRDRDNTYQIETLLRPLWNIIGKSDAPIHIKGFFRTGLEGLARVYTQRVEQAPDATPASVAMALSAQGVLQTMLAEGDAAGAGVGGGKRRIQKGGFQGTIEQANQRFLAEASRARPRRSHTSPRAISRKGGLLLQSVGVYTVLTIPQVCHFRTNVPFSRRAGEHSGKSRGQWIPGPQESSPCQPFNALSSTRRSSDELGGYRVGHRRRYRASERPVKS